MLRSVVIGCGAYLPTRLVTNQDMAFQVDTSDEWIAERTGIRQRYLAAEGELTSDLAAQACKAALANAGLAADDIDLIVLATTTPDDTMPSTATSVQRKLGMTRGAAFDVAAACSGFVYALAVADNFLRTGSAHRALVIGAEVFSRILDWNDRATCVLFGDGAGAIILEAQKGTGTVSDRGVLHHMIASDGRQRDILYTTGGVGFNQVAGVLTMAGKEVFRHAAVNMAAAIETSIMALGIEKEQIDWVVPHQANQRILSATAKKLGISEEKMISTVARHANTSAASIPLALAVATDDGRIRQGQLLALTALGAGLTWGSCIIRW